MHPIVVTILTRPGCHLCDEARVAIESIVSEFSDVRVVEKSILDDAQLHERYVEEIPVVLIDGTVHAIWRVDPQRLRAALERARV